MGTKETIIPTKAIFLSFFQKVELPIESGLQHRPKLPILHQESLCDELVAKCSHFCYPLIGELLAQSETGLQKLLSTIEIR